MTAKRGQVALYLVLTLVAITFLMVMNVGAYLAVSARNRTMNAGDAAAIAVAKHQGELLNRIGELNVEHLKLALEGGPHAVLRIAEIRGEQARLCFLGPLEGIARGNQAARDNGIAIDDGMTKILKQHAFDIRSVYVTNPQSYPEPWKGAWEEYAQRLELALGDGLRAGPDNVEFVDAAGGHMLLNKQFYHAIAGRNWCWFNFNAKSLIDGYASYRDWGPLPVADPATRLERCQNCEVYSLHLVSRQGSALDLFGKEAVARLLERSVSSVTNAPLLKDRRQVWFCYGGEWRTWWEIDPDGEWQFPVVGKVKSEYDVRGCAAICRCTRDIPNVVDDAPERRAVWSAAAKPFGKVENDEGQSDVVTALGRLVTPAFDSAHLVPLDTVGGRDLSTADADWMTHVREHLPYYLDKGPHGGSCWYCQQLFLWEQRSFRKTGSLWIRYHGRECIRNCGGGGTSHGGSAHGH